jgi:hypothetical protein
MIGGEKGLVKGDRAEVTFPGGTLKTGKVFQSTARGTPENTVSYKLQWDDGTASEWIDEVRVSKIVDPPVPTAEGRGRRRKTRRKRSKRKKTHRR